jgi:photosystem II stability/assembly factor-like uncharacterized protein
MRPSAPWVAMAAAAAILLVGCGSKSPTNSPGPLITGPPMTTCGIAACPTGPATPTTQAAATTTSTTPTGPWTDVTGNLAGLASQCGNLSLVATDPLSDRVIAGVAGDGLWETTGGSTWTQLPGSTVIANRPSSITFDPADPNRFWESGIYNGPGAFVTQNDGQTFTMLGNLVHTDDVSIDLGDPNRQTMLSGRHEADLVFLSTNGGSTWVNVSAGLPTTIGFANAPLVLNSQDYLMGANHGEGSGVFRTTNAGQTWTETYPSAVAGPPLVDTAAGGAIYWLLVNGGVIKSTDQGASWTLMPDQGFFAATATTILLLPDGHLATVGGGVTVSSDGGATWQPYGPPLPSPPTGLVYSAAQKAFYAWRSDCNAVTGNDPVKPGSIMKLVVTGDAP